jgi:hypothetical protein
MMAAGHRGAAEGALSFVFDEQQRPDGSIRQNTFVDGTPHWDGTQQDEVAFPIVLAWQLGRDDAQTDAQHVKPAAEWLVRTGPKTDMDRWENQDGWSPGTIASEIAGLVCAAQIARKNGDETAAATYEAMANQWRDGRAPGSSTRASSSSCASASSAATTRRSSTRSASWTSSWRSTPRRGASGTAPTSTATASSSTASPGTRSRRTAAPPAAGRGRSSPASAASTTSSPGSRPPPRWPPSPAPPTRAA